MVKPSSYTARDVGDALEAIAPLSTGLPGDELGFIYGDPSTSVRGLAVMWNAHTQSIQAAIDAGCNMLLVHESLFFRPQTSNWYEGPTTVEAMRPNQSRRKLLDEHGVVVYRSHSNWDALAIDGVPDQAVDALGIAGLKVIGQQRFFKVHRMPAPMSARELAGRAQRGLDLPWPPRLFGNSEQRIETFAFLIGGFGGNQINMPHAAADLGAQCLLIGEMLEWVVIQSLELGLPVIETLHSRSEIPALKRQAQMLAGALPGLPVTYVDSGAVSWR